ncbi:hypothetical protein RHGRI_004665 [Rhododendron griersonianum]|uniref:Uncharacterized protein n=1 Tax=Rhododendron griersonianum TaxID=479676 RepID=A0AAV6L9F4_9ERIC|nr:hypothetical protein RHGRI_004665 [Rhododendron griersonianum]
MDFRFWMTLLLAMAVVVEPSAVYGGVVAADSQHGSLMLSHGSAACNVDQVGDRVVKAEETMVGRSEGSRRTLAQRHRLISLRVFKKNHIPCHHRGLSYYDCYLQAGGMSTSY